MPFQPCVAGVTKTAALLPILARLATDTASSTWSARRGSAASKTAHKETHSTPQTIAAKKKVNTGVQFASN